MNTDSITGEYLQLSNQNVIPDMAEYAAQWALLALKAEAHNRPSLAATCAARAEHYGRYDKGEYIKLVEGPLAELFGIRPAGQE